MTLKLLYHIPAPNHRSAATTTNFFTFLFSPSSPQVKTAGVCWGECPISTTSAILATPTIYYICLDPTTFIYVYPSPSQVRPMTLPGHNIQGYQAPGHNIQGYQGKCHSSTAHLFHISVTIVIPTSKQAIPAWSHFYRIL